MLPLPSSFSWIMCVFKVANYIRIICFHHACHNINKNSMKQHIKPQFPKVNLEENGFLFFVCYFFAIFQLNQEHWLVGVKRIWKNNNILPCHLSFKVQCPILWTVNHLIWHHCKVYLCITDGLWRCVSEQEILNEM